MYASNAAGEVLKYAAATLTLVASWAPAKGVPVNALVAAREALVVGCADGVVRWMKYGDGGVTRSVSGAARARVDGVGVAVVVVVVVVAGVVVSWWRW